MTIANTKVQLLHVLGDPDNRVIALTGKWGTGKTHLWNDIKHGSDDAFVQKALANLRKRWRARRGDFSGDPHLDNIDWMMDVNEQAGNRVAFYFITAGSHKFDARYRMDEPVIRRLLRRIHERDHEIGLHHSYMTYQDPEQTRREADILRRTLDDEGIPYAELGGRQHYLRWQTPQTARNLEAADMAYDSTLSYADRPGFRCGTSREFTMYDVVDRRPIKLKQRPLVLMETTVVAEHYQGDGYNPWRLKRCYG